MSAQQDIGEVLHVDGHDVLIGTCSWTDKTLVLETDWYPERTMSAEERLRFYAAHFPLTEIDATYYAPPAEQQAALWAERTPDGFRFDVKAYWLLTGHPTKPQSLWKDLREDLPAEVREKRNLYAKDLSPEAMEEGWRRFESALRPLHEADRLGVVLFQYPPCFTPRKDNRAEIEALRDHLPDYRVAVEFRPPRWLAEERDRERTLGLLEDRGLTFVSVDAPEASGLPWVFALTTPDLFVVRFHGRSDSTWKGGTRTDASAFVPCTRMSTLGRQGSQGSQETHSFGTRRAIPCQSSRLMWCNASGSSSWVLAAQAALRATASSWSCWSSEFFSSLPAARIRAIDSAER